MRKKRRKKTVLPMIPLRGFSVFPYTVIHFDVGREKSMLALDEAVESNQMIFLSTQINAEVDLPKREDVYTTGTVCKVKQMLKLPGNSLRVLVEGIYRAQIQDIVSDDPFFLVETIELPEEEEEETLDIKGLRRMTLRSFEQYVMVGNRLTPEVLLGLDEIEDIGQFCDVIISHLMLKQSTRQELLETYVPSRRLRRLYEVLLEEIEILEIENKIENQVKQQVNQFQKDYYLREQIRAIHKELGEESASDEAQDYREKLNKLELADHIHEKIEKEINRYAKTSTASAESSVIRTYLETVLELPWNKSTEDNNDIDHAQKVLDEDHYGMEKVKERILEFLAVRQISKNLKSPIICLVGPPGVGKTSIAKSVARSLNREFIRMSLGGVRDESEIRGHRRTYVGAIPGRIISSIKDVKVNNPVFLFDEIDKMTSDFRGDPASAMLEVLDPEQNKDFVDHYLELPFDLSKVLFITTANTLSTIPRPLYDRMEVIELSGYTEQEKVRIAADFLVPKVCAENGLGKKYLRMSDEVLFEIIRSYTKESGVRGLEREIGKICRKCAIDKVRNPKKKYVLINAQNLQKYLGKQKFRYSKADKAAVIGAVNGMAWTQVGGETLNIEAMVLNGSGKLELTGKLGEVMKESAKAGHSYLRNVAENYGISGDFYKEKDIHIHIPEGAIPKDGPSAGVSMFTAMISALGQIPIRSGVAMTGEITLRGRVLPVGGIKEKVLAAYRSDIREIILPIENEKDIEDIPKEVRDEIHFHLVEHLEEVLDISLEKSKKKTKKTKGRGATFQGEIGSRPSV
ncbi:endopeptidase La [Filifactor villosus]|uniref:Lon protease n=1 Tax=Filifactor villosus TaxID=29374 RepID=A0ABV9QJT6_9FIRM